MNDKINVAINREKYTDLSKSFPIQRKHKIFDCHSDMLYDLWTRKAQGIQGRFETYHANQLRNSVIGGALWTMYSEFDFNLIEACKIALDELKVKNDIMPDFEVILGLEGLRNLHEISELDTLYDDVDYLSIHQYFFESTTEENYFASHLAMNNYIDTFRNLTKYLKKTEEKGIVEKYFLQCKFCSKFIPEKEFDEHYERCLDVGTNNDDEEAIKIMQYMLDDDNFNWNLHKRCI